MASGGQAQQLVQIAQRLGDAGRGAPAEDRDERSVTPLELFFDLVFVVAITQVTALLADEVSWDNVARGLLVLAALWWAWVGYSWLTNAVDPDEGMVRIAIFAAMAAMLVAALAVPKAFGDGAEVFGIAYLLVRFGQVALLWLAGRRRGDDYAREVRRLAPWLLIGPLLILSASFFDGYVQGALWALAIAIDYAAALRGGGEGWSVSAGHFAERHGLIVIIALGESLVAIGVGLEGLELGPGEIAAAVLGVALAALLWWTYFDVVALVAESRLRAATGAARSRMARDSYSYLHLGMIAGIIFVAFGLKKVLGHVDHHLDVIPAVALCGGTALYFAAHVLFRLRNTRTLAKRRVGLVAVCLLLILPALVLPAIATLALLCVLIAALVAYEAIRFSEPRARVRAALRH